MGTRHRQLVITKDGDAKVRQYGQWDGYPSHQGVKILEYLRSANLEKYQQNLEKLRPATNDELDAIDKLGDVADDVFPYLSRDCGAKIHKMIEDGIVKFVQIIPENEAIKWCKGFYTIDFQTSEFVSEYGDETVIFPLNGLPTNEEYLSMFTNENDN